MEIDLYYSLAGALTGFVVGLTGVGGGALMTPILLIIFDVSVITAVATDLWFAAITKIATLGIHHNKRQIDWKVARLLWMGSIPFSFLIVIAVVSGSVSKISGFLPKAIGVLVLITALGLVISSKIKTEKPLFKFNNIPNFKKIQPLATILAGAVLGIIVSLTSVGAGVFGTLILIYLYSYRMSSHKVVATDIAHAIPLALVAGTGYLISGKVNLSLLTSLLIGSIPTAILGAVVAHKISDRLLKLTLSIVLFVVGLKLVF